MNRSPISPRILTFAPSAPALMAVFLVAAHAAGQPASRAAGSKAGRGSTPLAPTPLDQAKAATAQAELDYKVGRFQEALDGYTKAYDLYPTPELLFNIGQCHKLLKNYERAIFFFRGYLRDKPTAANRAFVEGLLAEAERARDEEQAQAKKEADERVAAERARAEAEARALQPPPPLPPSRSPALRIAGIAVGGAGLAALGTGVYFGLQSRSAASDIAQLSSARGTWTSSYQSLYSQGQTDATAATILYIAGGVTVAAGALLTVLGWPKKNAEASVTTSFVVGPGAGAFVVRGAF